MRSSLLLISAVLFSGMFTSCSQYYYMPNMHQVPLLREKGETRVAYAGSTEAIDPYAEVSGSELQLSSAISDKIGLMLNGASFRSPWSDGTGRLIEAGVGRFQALGRHWTGEGYTGIGRGDAGFEGERIALWRMFAQSSIGYASRNFDFAVTTRICYLDFDSPHFTGMSASSQEGVSIGSMLAPGRVLVEPGAVLRVGWRSVKFQFQYAHSTNLSRPLSMLEDNYSLGLQFNLNNSFTKRMKAPKQ